MSAETMAQAIRNAVLVAPLGPNSRSVHEAGGSVFLTSTEAEAGAAAALAWVVARLDDPHTRAALAAVLDETGWERSPETGEWVRCPAPGPGTYAAVAIVKTALGAAAPPGVCPRRCPSYHPRRWVVIGLIRALVCPFAHLTLVVLDAATRSPGPLPVGEAGSGPGLAPEGEGAPTVASPRREVVSEQVTPRPPAPGIEPEVLIDWHADRARLSDTRMAELVGRWTKEHQ